MTIKYSIKNQEAEHLKDDFVSTEHFLLAMSEEPVLKELGITRDRVTVTHRDSFTVDASGTVAQAQSALHVRLGLYRPRGGTEQVVADKPMSVPAAIADSVTTIRVSQATVPMTPHEQLAPVPAHPQPLAKIGPA